MNCERGKLLRSSVCDRMDVCVCKLLVKRVYPYTPRECEVSRIAVFQMCFLRKKYRDSATVIPDRVSEILLGNNGILGNLFGVTRHI